MRVENHRRRSRSSSTDDQMEKEKVNGEQILDMSGMSLESVPVNPSLNLACITKLDLSNNNLQSIPESLTARLLNVEELDVHSNQLKSLPNSIGCLSKLKILDVSGNLLESLPRSIDDCRSLEELNANFNQLTRLPDTIGFELRNLRKLSLHSNKLVFLPSSTSHLTSLRFLDLHLNRLQSLPDGIENLTLLHTLDLSHNFHHLSSLPYSLGLLTSLSSLDISYNNLTELPESFSCLAKLRNFKADGNPLKSPPMAVVGEGLDAVREFLTAKMNEGFRAASTKKSWVGRLVKYGTFGGRRQRKIAGNVDGGDDYLFSYHSLDSARSSPSYLSMLSPRRLFSPKRSSSAAASPHRLKH